jgi:orotidine-5'-phosphate decarboxylase
MKYCLSLKRKRKSMNRYEISTVDGDVHYYSGATYLQAALKYFEEHGKLDGPWCVTNLATGKQEIVEQQVIVALRYYNNNYGEEEEAWLLST